MEFKPKNHNYILVGILFLITFLVRFGLLLFSDNYYSMQPMMKIIAALHIFKLSGIWDNINFQHLPLYLYFLASSISLGAEQLISARFLSVFFGSLTVVPFFYLTSEIFSKRIAVMCGILFCVCIDHVILSIVTVSDVVAIFFVICCLYCFFRDRIMLAALMLSIACGFSYMPWLVIPVMTGIMLLRQKDQRKTNVKKAFLFFAVSIIMPLIWSSLIFLKYHNLHFLTESMLKKDYFLFFFTTKLREVLITMFSGISILSFLGFWRSQKDERKLILLGILTGGILIGNLGLFHVTLGIARSMNLLITILLIPFIVLGGDWLFQKLRIKSQIVVSIIILTICTIFICLTISLRPLLPDSIKQMSGWLNSNISVKETIRIDLDSNDYDTSIIILSHLPPDNFSYSSQASKELVDYLIVEGEKVKESIARGNKRVASFGLYSIFKVEKKL